MCDLMDYPHHRLCSKTETVSLSCFVECGKMERAVIAFFASSVMSSCVKLALLDFTHADCAKSCNSYVFGRY